MPSIGSDMDLLRAWDHALEWGLRSVDEWQLVFPEKNPERRWPGPADCIERAREGDG